MIEMWKCYPIGKGKCHCGSNTYISGRGKHMGWSGIECCSCGNMIEACACGGRLPTKEQEKQVIQDQKCMGCDVYEKRDVYIQNGKEYIIENRYICTVTGLCEKRR